MNAGSSLTSSRLRRRRRRLLLWSALPVLLLLCVAAKLLSVGVLAGNAAAGFDAHDARAVASAAAGLRPANVIEPHKAAFAEGDARVLSGDFEGARERFEEALGLAGPKDQCVIRVNLVLSIERLGDAQLAAKDPTAAGRLFANGLAVASGAPEECFPGQQDPADAGDAGRRLEEAETRLRQKAEDANTGAVPQEPAGADAKDEDLDDPEQQSQLEQLKETARQSQLDRNNGKERDDYLRDGDYGSGPDKPW